MGTIDLSEAALIAAAHQETGLAHFGDESFLPAMRTLLDAVEKEANLNPFGRFIAKARTLGSLKNRLWADACFEAYPEIRQRKIVAPIIIVGPHRSGTTRMQRMLATDTRLQYLKTWEGINPAPRLDSPELGKAARYEEARQMIAMRQEVYPGASAHPMDADWPEEEMLLLNHSFCSFSALGLYNIPGYYQWFLDADKSAAYRYMADMMKLISWSRGDPENKRWILKNPQHMLDLDVLLTIFPDAKLVFTHRDPLKTVGSMMSLVWFFAVQHTDIPCRAKIREVWMDFCEQLVYRCMQMRKTIPASQQTDVYYADMNRDWRAEMRRVYEFADMKFTADAENAMTGWLDESEREGLHSGHRYTLEDFGTTAEEVDARMRLYREHYTIPYEKGRE
jgi:phage pi2 protein 07